MSEHQALLLLRIVWAMIKTKESITSSQLREWARQIAWEK